MAFGDVVQTTHAEFASFYAADLTVTAPIAGNLLVILASGQGGLTINTGSFEAGFTERFNVNNPDGASTSRLVLYDKISAGTEGTTIHAEWTDYNSGAIVFVEFAAAGATISHDVSAAIKQTDTVAAMASPNVDPTDGQNSLVLGLFGRVFVAGSGSSYSAGTIKGSATGVVEAKDYGPSYWATCIQALVDTNVVAGNYFSGVTVSNNISGNDVGVAAIAIYKGGAGGGGGDTLMSQTCMISRDDRPNLRRTLTGWRRRRSGLLARDNRMIVPRRRLLRAA